MKTDNKGNPFLWRAVRRGAAVCAAVTLVLTLPADWGQTGRILALAAAALRQPAETAALLNGRLEESGERPLADTLQQPPAAAPPLSTGVPDGAVEGDGATLPVIGQAVLSVPPPAEDGSGGKIVERKLATGDTLLHGVAVLNRSGTAVDIAAALARKLTVGWKDTAEPQVLIIHTHTTEGYMLYDAGYYNAADRNRTRQEDRNVCAVGAAVKGVLEQAGVAVIHDTTVHDDPQYNGAYTRSAETVKAILKQYPSIQVVLDLHRDAVMDGDTTLVKPTVTVEGKKAAQMMLLAGVVSTKALPHKNWEQNLTFAARWQQALDRAYPGLMRPLNTVASRYNQQLSPGYLLVEVGSEGNTLEEAVYSATLLGKTLAELLAP